MWKYKNATRHDKRKLIGSSVLKTAESTLDWIFSRRVSRIWDLKSQQLSCTVGFIVMQKTYTTQFAKHRPLLLVNGILLANWQQQSPGWIPDVTTAWLRHCASLLDRHFLIWSLTMNYGKRSKTFLFTVLRLYQWIETKSLISAWVCVPTQRGRRKKKQI